MKKTLCLVMATVLLLSLCACSGGISVDEAQATVKDFFNAIANEEYDAAESLLHPDRPADIEEYILAIEKDLGIDFSQGIDIEKYTGYSSYLHDSSVGGSIYGLTMEISVEDTTLVCSIETVRNDNGYGIYNFVLDTQQ